MATQCLDARQQASWKLEIYRKELLEMGELRHQEPDGQSLAALNRTPAPRRSHFRACDGHPLDYGAGAYYPYHLSEYPCTVLDLFLLIPAAAGETWLSPTVIASSSTARADAKISFCVRGVPDNSMSDCCAPGTGISRPRDFLSARSAATATRLPLAFGRIIPSTPPPGTKRASTLLGINRISTVSPYSMTGGR